MNFSSKSSSIAAMLALASLAAVIIASCCLISSTGAFSLGGRDDGTGSEELSLSSGLSRLSRNKRALFGGPSGDSGLELCKIFKNKAALAAVDEVCHRCYELFRKENLHIQCRAKCYNNEIFEECARVVLQESLIEQRQKYL